MSGWPFVPEPRCLYTRCAIQVDVLPYLKNAHSACSCRHSSVGLDSGYSAVYMS